MKNSVLRLRTPAFDNTTDPPRRGVACVPRLPRQRECAVTSSLLPCLFLSVSIVAYAQIPIKEIGHAPVSPAVARQLIRTLLEKVDPGNRQQTVTTLSGLTPWYRDLLDEELIAAWRKDTRANLTEMIEPLADPAVAAGVVEFSWRQQREATFTSAYAPMLGRLMARYADSAKPFLDDLLGSTAAGRHGPDLSQPEAEAVCRILLDMPDIGTWRESALQILPRYRRAAEDLLDKDLQGSDREKMYRATRWLVDLRAADSSFGALHDTAPATPRLDPAPPASIPDGPWHALLRRPVWLVGGPATATRMTPSGVIIFPLSMRSTLFPAKWGMVSGLALTAISRSRSRRVWRTSNSHGWRG